MYDIKIKAGEKAYQIIKDGGFSLDSIKTYFAPAGGPKWLVASGFDLTLLQKDLLGQAGSVLLVGSSAGAWRFAAWMQPEPEKSYQTFRETYLATRYKKKETPKTILQSLEDTINAYIEDDALPFALANKKYRLAIITARAKHLMASEVILIQKMGLVFCFLFNMIDRANLYRFAERVVFYSGPKPPGFCLQNDAFIGKHIPLSEVNFKQAVVASGAIPLVVTAIRDIYGAPAGVYRDGGLIDYHLTHRFTSRDDEMTLFFHHQKRIIPGWLDKKLKSRQSSPYALENVLMVYPSEAFVERLPGGKVPDRDDFIRFGNDQELRIKSWRQAVELAAPLGEQFLELIESNKLKDAVEMM